MTLNELDKNSKFGYRRKAWEGSDTRVYIGFDGTTWKIVYPDNRHAELISQNAKTDDWYLTDIPNMHYKRVAIVTKDVNGHPVGARIVPGRNRRWALEDGTSDREYYHLIGESCEWEDEMESEFPCFRKFKNSSLVVKFTSEYERVVVNGEDSQWIHYEDPEWVPCEDEMESPFPCFRKNKAHKHIVMFTSYKSGSVVKEGNLYLGGEESSCWVSYDNTGIWEPCEDPRQKRKFKVGDRIRYRRSSIHTIAFIEDDRYRLEGNSYLLFTNEDLWELVSTAIQPSPKPEEPENLSCSSESIPTQQKQKENKMDLRLLLAMMAAMSEEETPKDATNSQYVVIVTKDDEYEGYFYSGCLDEVEEIAAKPSNELKKFHVFDYSTTLAQKPRKVVTVERS